LELKHGRKNRIEKKESHMPIMTLPVWIFILSVGIPSLCLLMLVAGLLRRRRKETRMRVALGTSSPAGGPVFSQHIHQHVLVQQIDAIFNALVAVIEAERVKLKALAMHTALQAAFETFPGTTAEKKGAGGNDRESDDDMGRTAAVMASDGMPPEQIARVLGLSRHEVALALKIRGTNRRLDAVA
jgi:hypothetical protein